MDHSRSRSLEKRAMGTTGLRWAVVVPAVIGSLGLLVGCEPAPGARGPTEMGPQGQWHAVAVEEPPAHPAQLEDRPLFTEHFPPEEFAERRRRVFEEVGSLGLAVLQGAPTPETLKEFRQSNEFYHLTGIESPHAYVLLDGATGETHLFLPPRDERREYGYGKVLSAEDGDLIAELAGITHVHSRDDLPAHLQKLAQAGAHRAVYTPFAPPELRASSRSGGNRAMGDMDADPLDTRTPRHVLFRQELGRRLPGMEVFDLTPTLDRLRLYKSEREMQLIRTATRLHGLAILDAIRSTRPGITGYGIEAVARYRYWQHEALGSSYFALAHVGPDAYMNHYPHRVRAAQPGDMLLLDYGPDYHYYTSDMARMWPANGRFNDVQRELYGFYLEFYEAILYRIRAGVTPQEILLEALEEHEQLLERWQFSKEIYAQAAEAFVDSYRQRAQNPDVGLGHWVGMSVHDPGSHSGPLRPGLVLVIEPQFRVPEEQIYIRLEDMIAITEDGVEIFSDFVPRDMESIERIVGQGQGILQDYRPLMNKDGEFTQEGERVLALSRR